MKILIDINHPAHVHLFKQFAYIMQNKGHHILFTTRKKEVTIDLLDNLQFPYISFGDHKKSNINKIIGMFKFDYKLYKVAKEFKPDLFLSMASIYSSHVARLLGIPHVAFEDSEPVPEHQILYVPFTNTILTPQGLKKDFGDKQIRYNGFHEIAYLHPNYFQPDNSVLKESGLKPNERFTLLRFVAFKASHDVGINGFSKNDKIRFVKELEKKGKVFITSEEKLDEQLKDYQIKVSPDKLQSLLYYADLYIGDSQTMATESALLGTPTIRCNSFAETKKEMSNFIELEKEHELLYNFNYNNKDKALLTALDLLKNEHIKDEWKKKKEDLFKHKIDVTAFMVWFIENYPQSVTIMKENPEFQNRFK